MTTPLELRVLGEVEVVADGVTLPLPPSRKTRALLAWLAVTGRPHRRERLCTMFWEVPDDPRGALRWSLSKLRPLLDLSGDRRLRADRESVTLDLSGVRVDVHELRARMRGGVEALPTETLEDLLSAFRGPFLEGLDLPNCPDFQAWCVAEREELRRLQARLCGELADRLAEEPARALPHARARVALDRYDGGARALLLRLLLATGRMDEADEQLRAGVAALSEVDAGAAALLARQWRELRRPAPAPELALVADEPEPEPEPEPEQESEAISEALAPSVAAVVPAAELEAASPPALRDLPAAERKHLTVLVADIAGSIVVSEDPELVLAILDPVRTAMRDAVERFGGTPAGGSGEELVALFGAPVAHEDHALRACLAALAMRDAVAGLIGDAACLRIGLHVGEAVVRGGGGDGGYEAIGGPGHLARAIAHRAAPGTILLSAATARTAEGFVAVRALQAQPLPGQAQPQELAELLGRTGLRSSWQARAARGLTRFTGREDELAQLLRALARAEAGLGGVVTVVGEPGMGKSRLAHEIVDRATERGWTVLAGEASPFHASTPHAPIKMLLRRWCGALAKDDQTLVAHKLERMVDRLDPALAITLPALRAVLDLPVADPTWQGQSPAGRRRRLLDSLKALLVRMSREAPLLLVVEDLHWIDGESQALLDALVDALGGLRLLLLGTHRPEYRHEWWSRSGFAQLRLAPLPGDAAESLLASLLGPDPELAELRRQLATRSEGTPLFLEECVRELVESGALEGRRGAYRLAGAPCDLAMPSSVRTVLAARIDRLPSELKGLLQVAAVVGREVPLDLLQAVTALSEADLRAALDALQAAELIYESGQIPALAYSFKHALTHDVAYDSLLRERRRAVHVELVRLIEQRHAERLDEHVERLAHHARAGGLDARAVDYLYRAATKAIQRSAHRQALDHLGAGLDILRAMPETPERLQRELDYHTAIGLAWMAAKGWGAQEVADAYARARVICERLGDDHRLFTVLRGQGQFHMIRGELATARTLGHRCLELARASSDDAVHIETHHLFWSNSFFMGDYEEAAAHAHRGMALYARERHHALTYVYSGHDPGVCCRALSAMALWQQGFADQALARCHEAIGLAEEIAHPLTTALAQWSLAYVHMFRREPEATLLWAEREVELCQEYLLPLLLSQGLFQCGWAKAQLGQVEDGIAHMEQGLDAIRATGAEMGLPWFMALLGEAYGRAGDVARGLDLIADAITTASRRGACFQLSEMHRLQGELVLLADPRARDEAGRAFERAVRIAGDLGARLPQLRAALALARLLRADGETAAIHVLLAPLRAALSEGMDTADLREADALLAR